MSKHKNKKNKSATPKEPVTRCDLCERIRNLLIEINALRKTNAMLSSNEDFHKRTSQKVLKLVDDLKEANDWHAKRSRRYRTMTIIAVLALILSCIHHIINIFF